MFALVLATDAAWRLIDRADAVLESARQALSRVEAGASEGGANIDAAKAEAGEADTIAPTVEALSPQARALRRRISIS